MAHHGGSLRSSLSVRHRLTEFPRRAFSGAPTLNDGAQPHRASRSGQKIKTIWSVFIDARRQGKKTAALRWRATLLNFGGVRPLLLQC
jgi:hypothetical protein